jgi:hypothetical protein
MKLNIIYFSEEKNNIVLISSAECDIFVVIDFSHTRLAVITEEAIDFLIDKGYKIIGAFYEN